MLAKVDIAETMDPVDQYRTSLEPLVNEAMHPRLRAIARLLWGEGITQTEAASLLGLTQTSVCYYAARIAKALKMLIRLPMSIPAVLTAVEASQLSHDSKEAALLYLKYNQGLRAYQELGLSQTVFGGRMKKAIWCLSDEDPLAGATLKELWDAHGWLNFSEAGSLAALKRLGRV